MSPKKCHIFQKIGLILISLVFCFPGCVQAQSGRDSTRATRLDEVSIESAQPTRIATGPATVQTLTAKQIAQTPSLQLSDALKFMSGVVVRDYGGTGGMKTVSVRGLGTQHTGVSYDGIPLTDCQTGQIDIGKLSLTNVSSISLTTGVLEDIFVPASLFSHSSLLSVRILNNIPKRPLSVKASLTIGSYGLVVPQVSGVYHWESPKKPQRRVILNFLTGCTRSKGNYPYLLHYGGVTDSTSRERRQNSDVFVWNTEANLLLQLDRTQQFSVKWYYYDSERGLPSATIYYNLDASQRLGNRNTFGQIHYHKYFGKKWAYQANGKVNYDHTHYFDPEYLNFEGYLDNHYRQYEGFLSQTVQFSPFTDTLLRGHHTSLRFALSNDLIYNVLDANNIDYEHPARFTTQTSFSGIFHYDRITLNGFLLLTTVNNLVQEAEVQRYIHLAPAIGLSVKLAKDLKLRAFYKNIFRMPTFNDLYYREVGNINLQPEKTHQMNIGVVLDQLLLGAGKVQLSTALDGYFNIVKDKIVAFPSRNLFSWTMLNYGKVYVFGAEWNLRMQYRMAKGFYLRPNGNVTYQKAIDRTDPTSKTFNHQIPYTPVWSGSASVGVQTPWITVTYSLIASGKRYALGQNIPANEVARYLDHSIILSHDILIKASTLGLKLELLNLSNKNYEVIRNYPMQGFGFRFMVYYEY